MRKSIIAAAILSGVLAGCVEPPAPLPMPDFLTMCGGDTVCAATMTYREEVRREEALAEWKLDQRMRMAAALGQMSKSAGTMADASRPSGRTTTTTCRKFGNIIRCTSR